MKTTKLKFVEMTPPYSSPSCEAVSLGFAGVLCGSIESGTGAKWGTQSTGEEKLLEGLIPLDNNLF